MGSKADLFESLKKTCAEINPNLLDELFSKTLLKTENVLKLVKTTDGDDLQADIFTPEIIGNFKMIILLTNIQPNQELASLTLLYKCA